MGRARRAERAAASGRSSGPARSWRAPGVPIRQYRWRRCKPASASWTSAAPLQHGRARPGAGVHDPRPPRAGQVGRLAILGSRHLLECNPRRATPPSPLSSAPGRGALELTRSFPSGCEGRKALLCACRNGRRGLASARRGSVSARGAAFFSRPWARYLLYLDEGLDPWTSPVFIIYDHLRRNWVFGSTFRPRTTHDSVQGRVVAGKGSLFPSSK